MSLGLSPYVTSTTQNVWRSRGMENDRPSPLRINKQHDLTQSASLERCEQQMAYPSKDVASPLQKQTASQLNVTKRRSLWALTSPSSQIMEDKQQESFPPRPYSVGPTATMCTPFANRSSTSEEKKDLRTAEEAEEMLREASRTYSGASDNSNSWNSFVSGGCSARKWSGTRSSSSVIRHASSSTNGPSCTIDMDSILPHVLSPHISIHADSDSRYFGQDCVWAVIEVSGILSHAYSADGTGSKPAQPRAEGHHLDLFFKHGCLHDLKIEIQPVQGTSVVQVFHEQSFPTIIYAGSKVLLLAQVRINPRAALRNGSSLHRRHHSDELMADLESQLGDSQMPYMKVRITYSHSAFSDYFGSEILVGVSQRCTRLETTAVGALKQHNGGSRWSPSPSYSIESLQAIMQRHWSQETVTEWLQRIKTSHENMNREPRQSRPSANISTEDVRTPVPIHRPALSMERMCQLRGVHRLSEPRGYVVPHGDGRAKRETKQGPNLGSLRSRRSWSRNSSGATSSTDSVGKKKSFAAGIWKTLAPSANPLNADGEGTGPGAWSWNSWF